MWPKYNLGLHTEKTAQCFRSDNNPSHLHIHLLCLLSQCLNLSVPVSTVNGHVWDASAHTHTHATHTPRFPLLPLLFILLLNCNPYISGPLMQLCHLDCLDVKVGWEVEEKKTTAHKGCLLCIKKIKPWNCLRPVLCLSCSLPLMHTNTFSSPVSVTHTNTFAADSQASPRRGRIKVDSFYYQ